MFQRSRAGFYEFVIFPVGGSIFYFDKSVRYKTRCKFLFCHWFLSLNMTTPLMKSLTMVCQSGATTTRTLCSCISNHYYEYTMREAIKTNQYQCLLFRHHLRRCYAQVTKGPTLQWQLSPVCNYSCTNKMTCDWFSVRRIRNQYTHGQTFEESTFKQ